MSWEDRLPKDWRVALAIVVLTIGGVFAIRTWVVSIAQAEDRPQRTAIDEMRPMVRGMYRACVKRGECDPLPEPENR